MFNMTTSRSMTAAITYVDRLLAFVVPLYVLKVLHNSDSYNAIEYVISFSVIVSTFVDLGIRNYILFQYRETKDKAQTTTLTLSGYFCAAVLQLGVITTAYMYVSHFDSSATADQSGLIVAALLRAGGLSATAIAYQLAILHGRPALASLPSLLQWLFVLATLNWMHASDAHALAYALIVPSLPLMAAGLILSSRALALTGIRAAMQQVRTALKWGWPVLVAAALSMGIAHISRIYGFTNLSQADLVAFNFWMRILSIVQLTHTTAMAGLTLEIYEHRGKGVISENIRSYATALCLAMGVAVVLHYAAKVQPEFAPSASGLTFLGICTYTSLWCFGAYLESYLVRDGRPFIVLKYAALSGACYLLLLMGMRPSTSESLAFVLAAPAAINLLLLIQSVWQMPKRWLSEKRR